VSEGGAKGANAVASSARAAHSFKRPCVAPSSGMSSGGSLGSDAGAGCGARGAPEPSTLFFQAVNARGMLAGSQPRGKSSRWYKVPSHVRTSTGAAPPQPSSNACATARSSLSSSGVTSAITCTAEMHCGPRAANVAAGESGDTSSPDPSSPSRASKSARASSKNAARRALHLGEPNLVVRCSVRATSKQNTGSSFSPLRTAALLASKTARLSSSRRLLRSHSTRVLAPGASLGTAAGATRARTASPEVAPCIVVKLPGFLKAAIESTRGRPKSMRRKWPGCYSCSRYPFAIQPCSDSYHCRRALTRRESSLTMSLTWNVA
jgi:hypothetical protein